MYTHTDQHVPVRDVVPDALTNDFVDVVDLCVCVCVCVRVSSLSLLRHTYVCVCVCVCLCVCCVCLHIHCVYMYTHTHTELSSPLSSSTRTSSRMLNSLKSMSVCIHAKTEHIGYKHMYTNVICICMYIHIYAIMHMHTRTHSHPRCTNIYARTHAHARAGTHPYTQTLGGVPRHGRNGESKAAGWILLQS